MSRILRRGSSGEATTPKAAPTLLLLNHIILHGGAISPARQARKV
jgi:hypothetical protein